MLYLLSSFVDLHIGHQQTRGLLEEVCLKQKPWTVVIFRHCCWKFVEGKKRDFAAKWGIANIQISELTNITLLPLRFITFYIFYPITKALYKSTTLCVSCVIWTHKIKQLDKMIYSYKNIYSCLFTIHFQLDIGDIKSINKIHYLLNIINLLVQYLYDSEPLVATHKHSKICELELQ